MPYTKKFIEMEHRMEGFYGHKKGKQVAFATAKKVGMHIHKKGGKYL